jgi:AraC family transcriptional regulator of adaptative response/methylated-DNA-[protein]-cysteine methyltransferase
MDHLETDYSYNVLKRALDEIDQAERALSLSELSTRMGMSSAHFQRLFSKWVGISPKKYQQYLMLEYSKELLKNHHSTLATAQEVGLSGAGRLHDLFVGWEAMSPGEFARQGNTIEIGYCWRDSAFGEALVMATDRGICGIAFSAETGRDRTLMDMTNRWPKAHFEANSEKAIRWAEDIFERSTVAPLHLTGAPFQIKVWEALMRIPSGHVTTYSDIAKAIGNPKATRAVGTAIGKNPISWIIPCHRALRKSGELGGYHWGLPIKRTMLAFESARRDVE